MTANRQPVRLHPELSTVPVTNDGRSGTMTTRPAGWAGKST